MVDKHIYIPCDLHKRIKKHCVEQDITLKDFVLELIDKGWDSIAADIPVYNDDGTPQK